ncbi:MAG: PAS domain S-box protein [Candidatus Kryptoniota bacterium]
MARQMGNNSIISAVRLSSRHYLIILTTTIFVIIATVVGTITSTGRLKSKLYTTVFRTNQLTAYTVASHLKDFLESRANGVRSLSRVLAADRRYPSRIADISDYFQFVKNQNIYSILLFSAGGKVLYSTNKVNDGEELSGSEFWKYVKSWSSRGITYEDLKDPSAIFRRMKPYAGRFEGSDFILLGAPIFTEELGTHRIRLDGAVAFLIDQFAVVGTPIEEARDFRDTTLKISVGVFSKSAFPFVHIWSNIPSWKMARLSVLQKEGRKSCSSCHVETDIEKIFSGEVLTGTAVMKTSLPDSDGNEFLWTSAPITSPFLELQEGMWHVVVSADRNPVELSVTSYMKGSIFLSVGVIVLLVIILTVNYSAARKDALEHQHFKNIEQLASLREQYEVLIEGSNDAIYISSGNSILNVNKRFRELFGYTLDEVKQKNFLDLVAPESQGLFEERLKRFQRGEKVEKQYAFTALTKSGVRIPVEISVAHIRYEGKVAAIGIIRDLSELTAQKELFETLFKNAPVGILIHREGRIVKANDAAGQAIGFTSGEEIVGHPVSSFIHPEDLEITNRYMENVYKYKITAPLVEERFIKKDGARLYVLATSVPIVYGGSDAVETVFVSIEDRKELEDRLARYAADQEREHIKLDTILQSLKEGIIYENEFGQVEYANSEYCRIFSFASPADLIGKNYQSVIRDASKRVKDPVSFIRISLKDIKTRDASFDEKVELVDGKIVEVSSFSFVDVQGNFIGRINIWRDITLRT